MLINTTIEELNSRPAEPNNEESTIPKFQFVDQNGQWFTATAIPTDTEFYKESNPVVTDNGAGGLLGIVPLLGGSGPQSVGRGSFGSPWARKRRTRSTSRWTTARSAR